MNPFEKWAELAESAALDLIAELGVFVASSEAGAVDEAEAAREDALASATALMAAASAIASRLNDAVVNPRRAEAAE